MNRFEEKGLLIGNKTVQKYVSVDEVIDIVSKTWQWFGNNEIIMPSKITTDMSSAGIDGWFNSMPCYIAPLDIAGIKVVGGYESNKKNNMPYIKANVLLTDPHTGILKALVSGDWISDYRTGAQPAIMIKHMAYKTDVVTIIGTGLQGYTSLDCMSRILDIKEVRIADLSQKAKENFMAKFDGAKFKMVDCADNKTACEGSDVIITVTNADADLVKADWVKPGTMVITMGSFHEVEPEVVRQADIIAVDHVAQSLHRGNLKPMAENGEITEKSFDVEIGKLLANKISYTPDKDKRVYAQIVGMGCPDVAVAETVRRKILASKTDVFEFDMQS